MGYRLPEELRKLLKYEDSYENEEKFDYSKGKIFILKSANTDRIYIGNTINSLEYRLYNMEQELLYSNDHPEFYREYFEILKKKDYSISLLEDYSCKYMYELERRTAEHIRKARCKCVNINIPRRLKSELISDVICGLEEEYLNKSRDFLNDDQIKDLENLINKTKLKNEKTEIKNEIKTEKENRKNKLKGLISPKLF